MAKKTVPQPTITHAVLNSQDAPILYTDDLNQALLIMELLSVARTKVTVVEVDK